MESKLIDRDAHIRVLLVDDDEDDFLIVREFLSELHHFSCELEWCPTFEEGLAAVMEKRHDVYLLDHYLGPHLGLDIIRMARERGVYRPMILLTGRDDDEVDAAAVAAGAADYLVKGQLSPPLLGRSIRYALAQQRHLDMVRQNEARLRAIIENSPDMVILHRERRIIYINPAGLKYLGYASADEVLGRPIAEFVHPDDRGEAERAWQRAGATEGATPLREVRFLCADERVRTAEVAELALMFEGQEAIMATARDVTERKELRARVVLSERMASLGTLAAGVAHEINNPMAFVLGNIDYACQELDSVMLHPQRFQTSEVLQDVRQALGSARKGAERVRLIVRDLRQFSRDEGDVVGSVDVHAVLDSTLTLAQNQIRHRAQVIKEYGEVPPVEANEARLGQVFLNLVVNAAQAIPEGAAPQNHIRIKTGVNGDGRVVVSVEDTGHGIEPSILDRIFDPFFTTKPLGEGTGLGLSICHGIISSYGGELNVSSQPGMGTEIQVVLPPAEALEEAQKPCATMVVPEERRGRVLVLDDEPLIGEIVGRILGSHEVVVCEQAKSMLDAMREGQERFDVILCDLMMPDITGIEFYHALREFDAQLVDRIVFITGGVHTSRARQFLESVPNQVLEKPFDIQQVRKIVHDYIEA